MSFTVSLSLPHLSLSVTYSDLHTQTWIPYPPSSMVYLKIWEFTWTHVLAVMCTGLSTPGVLIMMAASYWQVLRSIVLLILFTLQENLIQIRFLLISSLQGWLSTLFNDRFYKGGIVQCSAGCHITAMYSDTCAGAWLECSYLLSPHTDGPMRFLLCIVWDFFCLLYQNTAPHFQKWHYGSRVTESDGETQWRIWSSSCWDTSVQMPLETTFQRWFLIILKKQKNKNVFHVRSNCSDYKTTTWFQIGWAENGILARQSLNMNCSNGIKPSLNIIFFSFYGQCIQF